MHAILVEHSTRRLNHPYCSLVLLCITVRENNEHRLTQMAEEQKPANVPVARRTCTFSIPRCSILPNGLLTAPSWDGRAGGPCTGSSSPQCMGLRGGQGLVDRARGLNDGGRASIRGRLS